MKKSMLLILVSILLCLSVPVSAASKPASVGLTTNQWEDAGICIENNVVVKKEIVPINNHNSSFNTCTSSNTDLTEDSFVSKTTFYLPKENRTETEVIAEIVNTPSIASAGNKTETGRDSAIAVEGYVTIYYDRITLDGVPYAKLTRIEGGYTILDRQVRVNHQAVESGCSGVALGGGVTQTKDYDPTTNSWGYNMPSDWVPVTISGITWAFIGATCTYTLQRVGSDYLWNFSVQNML